MSRRFAVTACLDGISTVYGQLPTPPYINPMGQKHWARYDPNILMLALGQHAHTVGHILILRMGPTHCACVHRRGSYRNAPGGGVRTYKLRDIFHLASGRLQEHDVRQGQVSGR